MSVAVAFTGTECSPATHNDVIATIARHGVDRPLAGPRMITPEIMADRLIAEAQAYQNGEQRCADNALNSLTAGYRWERYDLTSGEVVIRAWTGETYHVNIRTRTCGCLRGVRAIEIGARMRHLPEECRPEPEACILEDRHVLIADALVAAAVEQEAR